MESSGRGGTRHTRAVLLISVAAPASSCGCALALVAGGAAACFARNLHTRPWRKLAPSTVIREARVLLTMDGWRRSTLRSG